jgi:hypothetical protein
LKRLSSLFLLSAVVLGSARARADDAPPPPPAQPAPAPATPPPAAPAAAPAPPPAAPAQAAAPAPNKGTSTNTDSVVEGELSNLGATKLANKDTRFGVLLGPALIGQAYYLSGSIEFDLQIGKTFGFGLQAPVNIPIYDPTQGFKLFPNGFKLRAQDYNTWQKFVRIVRYLTIGHKEGDFFLNFSTDYAATIGHGTEIRRYATNINLDDARLLGELDAKFKYGGFELMVGNVVSPLNMMGALLYAKPFGGWDLLELQRLSIGLEYSADWYAPLRLATVGYPHVEPGAASAFPLLDPAQANDAIKVGQTAGVHLAGVSIETKVLKTDNVDIKPYFDFSKMIVGDGKTTTPEGSGLTLGALARLGFGHDIHSAFRAVLEGRLFQPNYIPGYFDSFYEVQKYQYITNGSTPVTQVPTKLLSIMCRSPAAGQPTDVRTLCQNYGLTPWTGPSWIPGIYGELTYSILDAFAITAAAQYSDIPGGTNLVLHAEVPTFSWLRFFGSVYRVNLANAAALGKESIAKQLTEDNTLIFAGARVKALPFLFINAQYIRAWLLETGTTNSFQISNSLLITLELGFEFSH